MKFESLSILPLTKYFNDEPLFTQWLCKNPSYLEQALNIELDPNILAEVKKKGGYVIDLVANINRNNNLKVVIFADKVKFL